MKRLQPTQWCPKASASAGLLGGEAASVSATQAEYAEFAQCRQKRMHEIVASPLEFKALIEARTRDKISLTWPRQSEPRRILPTHKPSRSCTTKPKHFTRASAEKSESRNELSSPAGFSCHTLPRPTPISSNTSSLCCPRAGAGRNFVTVGEENLSGWITCCSETPSASTVTNIPRARK